MKGVLAVLLAGGQARRMGGGDKCLRPLAGRPLLAHVIDRVRPQAEALLLNANGDATRFDEFGLPVKADIVSGYVGPLAGILTGMNWARSARPDAKWLLSIATDTPFFPGDLASRMLSAAQSENKPLACAKTLGRTHPVFGLWSLALTDDLDRAVRTEEMRKIDRWTARYPIAEVEFSAQPFDPFFNANRSEDLEEAERLLQKHRVV